MTESDRPEFVRLIADVCGFYKEPVSDFSLSVWIEACRSFPLPSVRKALTAHAMNPDRGQFCPKPADVIRYLRGNSKDEALAAWQNVIGQVSSVGRYGSPRLTDSERQALTAIGGWQRICNSREDELGFLQKQFTDNFGAYVAQVEREEISPEIAALAGKIVGRIANGD